MYRLVLLTILILNPFVPVYSINQTPQQTHVVSLEQGQIYSDNRPLRVGVVHVGQPYIQSDNYSYSESMMDIMHSLLKTTGYNYEYVVDTLVNLQNALAADSIDIIFGIPKVDGVHTQMLCSMPFMDIPYSINEGDEDGRTQLTACTTLEHNVLMRQINNELLKHHSGYILGYFQQKWFGVTMYRHQYAELQRLLYIVLSGCAILAIFLIFVFIRVAYLSRQSFSKSQYMLRLLDKFPIPLYILKENGDDVEYEYINDVALSEQYVQRENCTDAALKHHKNRLKCAYDMTVTTHDNSTFVDRRTPESPYTVHVSYCTFEGRPHAVKTVVNTKELLLLKEIAEKNNKEKDEFLINISHEVRTPLNSILGFCQLLPELPEEDKKEALEIIDKKSKQLHKLINDILLLAKLETGEIEVHYARRHNCQWMPSIIDKVQAELDAPATVPVIYDQHDCCCNITIDKELTSIILTNLLQNAIRFTHQGTIHIGCTCVQDHLVYYVQDSGIGMTIDQCSKIFNRFYKINNFTQGTGLGMPIVLKTAEILGAHLGLYSVPEQGTTFYLCCPIPTGSQWQNEDNIPSELRHMSNATWMGDAPNIHI